MVYRQWVRVSIRGCVRVGVSVLSVWADVDVWAGYASGHDVWAGVSAQVWRSVNVWVGVSVWTGVNAGAG